MSCDDRGLIKIAPDGTVIPQNGPNDIITVEQAEANLRAERETPNEF
jgi:hypothetical protein